MPELHPPPIPPDYPPSEDIIKSQPPPGKKRITDIYWDPDTQEYVFKHED